jgi:RHS repeat-associated protein
VAKLGSGGAVTASYILGLGGEQVTELNVSRAWVHSNAYAGGRMVATYEGPAGQAAAGYHFHLTDWLGTNRMQVSPGGGQDETCTSYPFGDGLNCTGPDATEHHFTGKERDTESGLDYFGARYLNSNLGRFMTPDWADKPIDVPYATFGDPQTLNLYAYVNNNPNTGIDVDGHVWGPVGPQWGGEPGYVGSQWAGTGGFGGGPVETNVNFAEGEARAEGLWGESSGAQGQKTASKHHKKKKHSQPALPAPTPNPNCPSGMGSNVTLQTTGYDNSFKSTGKNPGDPGYGKTTYKEVAAHGTIASNSFPQSTVIYVPGYGLGAVSDTGGMKIDTHIDLWFSSESEANAWGFKEVEATVCTKVDVKVVQ